MDKLSSEIVHLSRILEKQIPKGYHEIATEYVRQNIVSAVSKTILVILLLMIVIIGTRILIEAYKNKSKSRLFSDSHFYENECKLNSLGIALIIASGFCLVFALFELPDIRTAIQHAVAPNYYLIKSFIK